MSTPTETAVATKAKLSRDQLRSKMLGEASVATRIQTTLFGEDVELRQLTMDTIVRLGAGNDDIAEELGAHPNTVSQSRTIIAVTMVPGTDEHVFEEGDLPTIVKWPFSEDLNAFCGKVQQITGVKVAIDEAEKVLAKDPANASS